MTVFLSLHEYLTISQKIIIKYTKVRYLAENEDLVADVARAIMVADWKYDPNVAALSTYRYARAVGYIRKYFDKKKKDHRKPSQAKAFSQDVDFLKEVLHKGREEQPFCRLLRIDEHRYRVSYLEQVITRARLTQRQLTYVHRYFVNDDTLQEIANDFQSSVQNIQQSLSMGLEKMQLVA